MPRAIDTNILVRLIARDDPAQFEKVRRLFESGPVLVLTTVLLETGWVLRSAFGFSPERLAASLEALLSLPNVELEQEDLVIDALALFRAGLDFADAIHLAGARECDEFLSFDAALVKRAQRSAAELPVVPKLL
ncbi:DNA-binding protein [Aureimonas endophytica]|uniref:DNA-binding protein n=1 Tax=Aureimonas endophytica TaxID=2027858 RepID=A0A916ZFC8_9HYPH|nr:type II toxin-antitoxin system VapC family toxin [Aureimonas endophytica]GGD91936.1 DNA-binding protein [Aureimonas endophytica]